MLEEGLVDCEGREQRWPLSRDVPDIVWVHNEKRLGKVCGMASRNQGIELILEARLVTQSAVDLSDCQQVAETEDRRKRENELEATIWPNTFGQVCQFSRGLGQGQAEDNDVGLIGDRQDVVIRKT
ncbi:MAG TPA: hypothetical protein DCR55_10845 [Lentisphaeria bacterium]|nr:hypothetical protein [Lentisphaeria bacterium]